MSQENVAIVRRLYESWGRGEFGTELTDLVDPYAVFAVRPQFPEFGTFVGPDGIEKFMRRFLEQWERLTIEAPKLESVGETVFAHVVQRGKGRASGIEGDNTYFMLFTFRAGRVIRIDAVMDEAEAREAAGLSE
jgi:ketosteroid isomerase-like protein